MSAAGIPANQSRRRRRRRITLAGIATLLGAVASLVTIANAGGSSSSTSTSTSGSTLTAYPLTVQANYLHSCENVASGAACDCTLSWLEANVSLAQFQQDEATAVQTGQEPADVQDAVAACT